jgi:hypothetical protein
MTGLERMAFNSIRIDAPALLFCMAVAPLLVGSGLLVTTMGRLHATDLGFRPQQLLSVRVALPGGQYDPDARKTFFSELVGRVGGLPGVQADLRTQRLLTTHSWTRVRLPPPPLSPTG